VTVPWGRGVGNLDRIKRMNRITEGAVSVRELDSWLARGDLARVLAG
jgi:hypothetical protein